MRRTRRQPGTVCSRADSLDTTVRLILGGGIVPGRQPGTRRCRWSAGLGVAGSETGLVDLDPDEVVHSGRLGPGQMLVVDLVNHKTYEDEALLELFDAGTTYATLVEDTPLTSIAASFVDPAALAAA